MTDFKAIAAALDERGFCVVPEFLSRDEIDFLVAEFDASPDYSPSYENQACGAAPWRQASCRSNRSSAC